MDLEYGKEIIGKYNGLYKKHKNKVWYMTSLFVVVTLAVILKQSIQIDIDESVASGSGFSLDEAGPELITLKKHVIDVKIDKESSFKKFQVKQNRLNRMIQTKNLANVFEEVYQHVLIENWECIHLKHFGVPYDIILFFDPNITMLEPKITQISDEFILQQEIGIDNVRKYIKRPSELSVEYLQDDLETMVSKRLEGDAAACFSYYYNIKF